MDLSVNRVDLSIVIVTWNVWSLLRTCLYSIEQCTRALPDTGEQAPSSVPSRRMFGPDNAYVLEVIVVDNNHGNDETVEALPAAFPWVRYLQSENIGFTGGNNLGYRASCGAFVFFLNPDTELVLEPPPPSRSADDLPTPTTDPGPLTQLYQQLQADPTLGMVGPQLRYGDGSWQNNRRRLPTRWTGFFESTWLGQWWPENPWAAHLHMRAVSNQQPHRVDWLNGSAMFCRRTALAAIHGPADPGPFDERFFMYSEELDLCQRMQAAGWQLAYLPTALIIHHEGRSSEQVVVQRHIRFNTSKVRYYQKYYGTLWASVLRLYLQSEYVVQILLETTKALLGHKTQLRWERVRGYGAILRSGFPLHS